MSALFTLLACLLLLALFIRVVEIAFGSLLKFAVYALAFYAVLTAFGF